MECACWRCSARGTCVECIVRGSATCRTLVEDVRFGAAARASSMECVDHEGSTRGNTAIDAFSNGFARSGADLDEVSDTYGSCGSRRGSSGRRIHRGMHGVLHEGGVPVGDVVQNGRGTSLYFHGPEEMLFEVSCPRQEA